LLDCEQRELALFGHEEPIGSDPAKAVLGAARGQGGLGDFSQCGHIEDTKVAWRRARDERQPRSIGRKGPARVVPQVGGPDALRRIAERCGPELEDVRPPISAGRDKTAMDKPTAPRFQPRQVENHGARLIVAKLDRTGPCIARCQLPLP
jgi:hypothetical protein